MAKKKSFSIGNALTAGLEETIGSAQGYSGELQVDVIPLRKISLDPENPRDLVINFSDVVTPPDRTDPLYTRKTQELETLSSLSESIRQQGILHPVTVYKHGEGYRLIAGERRTLASLQAGKTDIQARILNEKPDTLKISLLQWIENVERSDLSLWERLRNLQKIVDAWQTRQDTQSITVTGLSQLIGCSKPQAMLYKAVLEADDTLLELIRDHKVRNLEKAAFLAGLEDPALREQMTQAIIEGVPLPRVKAKAKQSQGLGLSSLRAVRRGRTPSTIQLGSTRNMKVARLVLESLFEHAQLQPHLANERSALDCHDPKGIAQALKQLMKKLEDIYA